MKEAEDLKGLGAIGLSGGAPLYIGVAFAVLFTFICTGVLVQSSESFGWLNESLPPKSEALSTCHYFIKDRLKAPSTAEFLNTSTHKDGSRYLVSGELDAQNSFGAMLRHDYRCHLRYDEGWKREEVTWE